MNWRALVMGAACFLSTGCGYHTAGRSNLLPADLRTLAVPAFVNRTQTYKIEQTLTAAVVQELTTRTKYRITADPHSADAVLRGTVLSTYTTPVTYDTRTGRASTVLVIVSMNVSLAEREAGCFIRILRMSFASNIRFHPT